MKADHNTSEKDFQRYSADAIYNKLFGDKAVTDHFLLADEVGLGKTVITKNVISRLLQNNPNKKIHIYYVCNNLTLADQNKKRLVPEFLKKEYKDWESRFLVRTDRLSLMHQEQLSDDSASNCLRIISLTPDTSLKENRMRGNRNEKHFIYQLLAYNRKDHELKEFLHAYFRGWLKHYFRDLNHPFNVRFLKEKLESFQLPESNRSVEKELNDLYIHWYKDRSSKEKRMMKEDLKPDDLKNIFVGDEFHERRSRLISSLVKKLALLNFDNSLSEQSGIIRLVVLDEFQRFDDILELKNNSNSIASAMFQNSKVLIVSATPYKAYSEEANKHYVEFKKVLTFLFEGYKEGKADDKVNNLEKLLTGYHDEIKSYFNQNEKDKLTLKEKILKIKYSIESHLKEVMIRTERYHFIKDKDKGIETYPVEITKNTVPTLKDAHSKDILGRSLKEYYWLSSSELLSNDAQTQFYWKSGDKLINFMDSSHYKYIGKLFDEGTKKLKPKAEERINEILRNDKYNFILNKKDLDELKKFNINNEKMGYLLEEFLSHKNAGKFLWVKPSFLYHKNDFFDEESEKARKVLIFSAWRFVPNYISAIVSYENERALYEKLRNIDPKRFTDPKEMSDLNQIKISEKQYQAGKIIYPSFFLSSIGLPVPDQNITLDQFIQRCKFKIEKELEPLIHTGKIIISKSKTTKGLKSKKLVQLDYIWLKTCILTAKKDPDAYAIDMLKIILPTAESDEDSSEEFNIEDFLLDIDEQLTLDPGDIEFFAEMMVGSPAICIARCLQKGRNRILYDSDLEKNYGELFYKDLRFFLQSRELYITSESYNAGTFINRIIDYCKKAHFVEVCEEYIYLLESEVHSLDPTIQLQSVVENLKEVFNLHKGRSMIRSFDLISDKRHVDIGIKNIPTDIAIAFGKDDNINVDDSETNLSKSLRSTTVRKAFNSPFFPFILASTSTGQEGLDFHYYCKDIMHWNLPNSPIDLEQREGRINRYNCLVVRQNIVDWIHSQKTILEKNYCDTENIWSLFFRISESEYGGEEKYNRGLFPHWLFPASNSNKLRRHIPIQTMSYDKLRFNRLIEYLAYYRLALGQVRQDDFINSVRYKASSNDNLKDELNEFTINLTPVDIYQYTTDYVNREILDNPDRINKLLQRCSDLMNTLDNSEMQIFIKNAIEKVKESPDIEVKRDYLERLLYFVNPFDSVPDFFKHGYKDDLEILKNGLSDNSKN